MTNDLFPIFRAITRPAVFNQSNSTLISVILQQLSSEAINVEWNLLFQITSESIISLLLVYEFESDG